MTNRIRQKADDRTGKYEDFFLSGSPTVSFQSRKARFQKVWDEVIVGNNGSLDIWDYKLLSKPVFSLQCTHATNNNIWVRYTDYPVIDVEWPPLTASLLGSPNVNALATKLAKMTHPGRAYVDLPVFIAELRELPDLIKIEGETLLKKGASTNLNYQFGWRPLISDLQKLLNFQSIVDKRYTELKAFYDHGLSCTRDLDSDSSTVTVASQNLGIPRFLQSTVSYTKTTKRKVWGHIKWFPTTLPPKSDQGLRRLAQKAVFGLTIDPATAWELIPFSWLADYFGSVGDFLIANRNIVPATYRDLSIMWKDETYTATTWTNLQFQWPRWSNGAPPEAPQFMFTEKHRRPGTVSIVADMPVLTARQLSILGSLAILKNR